jgi:Na+/H+ antiporter NhaD/arsenite permease-like protein
MELLVWIVFAVVYLGMVLGDLPGLAIDRTGVALLGAIVLLAAGVVGTGEALSAVHFPTMALLFGLMVLSAQFRLSGFYSNLVRRVAEFDGSPRRLLAVLIAVIGLLSALLANDIVCLAAAPVLIESCARRGLNPKPFLFGLACAANVGSTATLIGNPQNMLIGQVLNLSFSTYLLQALAPTVLGLGLTWWIIVFLTGDNWRLEFSVTELSHRSLNLWQTGKGLLYLAAILIAFLFLPWPRELAALAVAGALLCSRRMATREMLGLVDWQLLVLFAGLFIVNHAMAAVGNLEVMKSAIAGVGIDSAHPAWLFGLVALLSNLVSNVPAVMLLLPSATGELAGPVLALASTLAGNLFIVGSIANIIVVDQAARMGVKIGFREHARIGVPVTIATLAVAAGWLWILSQFS